jgi:hypothetical protein
MSRNVAALGALFIVGALLWLVMAWHAPQAPTDEEPVAQQEEQPALPNAVAPQPSAARQAEPSLAPAAAALAPELEEPPKPQAPPQDPLLVTQPDGTRVFSDQIKADKGPVAEYRALYESESRDYAAGQVESVIRNAFTDPDKASDLIKSISCRETICKLEMRWSADRLRPYIAGIQRAEQSVRFKTPFALSPVSPPDGKGVRLVEVYLKRKPAGEKEAPHAH